MSRFIFIFRYLLYILTSLYFTFVNAYLILLCMLSCVFLTSLCDPLIHADNGTEGPKHVGR